MKSRFIKKGETQARKEAIKVRNELGRLHWKKFGLAFFTTNSYYSA